MIQIPHISITKLRNINFNTCCCHIKYFGIKSCKLIKWKIKTREITYSKLKLDSIIKCNILPTGRERERKSFNQMRSIICERRYQKSQNTAAQHIMRLSFTFIYIHNWLGLFPFRSNEWILIKWNERVNTYSSSSSSSSSHSSRLFEFNIILLCAFIETQASC